MINNNSDLFTFLCDIGCDDKTIEQYIKLEKEQKNAQQIKVLNQHREKLLRQCHVTQKKLDILDFYLFQKGKVRKEQSKYK